MAQSKDIQREERAMLLELPEFRRFLFELLSASGITRTTREEPNVLLLEGKRSLGLEILGWFTAEAEPHDVIALAIAARNTTPKGARRDDRDSDE